MARKNRKRNRDRKNDNEGSTALVPYTAQPYEHLDLKLLAQIVGADQQTAGTLAVLTYIDWLDDAGIEYELYQQDYKDSEFYYYIVTGSPVVAIAHCDTVGSRPYSYTSFTYEKDPETGENIQHKKVIERPATSSKPHFTNQGDIVSIALDDRLGVYALCDLFPRFGCFPNLLLTTGEESGSSTIREWMQDHSITRNSFLWAMEIDRHGTTEAVHYGNTSMALLAALDNHGFTTNRGTYTDVAEMPVPSVNFAASYTGEHSSYCRANLAKYEQCVLSAISFFQVNEDTDFGEIDYKYPTTSYYGRGGTYYDSTGLWDGTDYDKFDWRFYKDGKTEEEMDNEFWQEWLKDNRDRLSDEELDELGVDDDDAPWNGDNLLSAVALAALNAERDTRQAFSTAPNKSRFRSNRGEAIVLASEFARVVNRPFGIVVHDYGGLKTREFEAVSMPMMTPLDDYSLVAMVGPDYYYDVNPYKGITNLAKTTLTDCLSRAACKDGLYSINYTLTGQFVLVEMLHYVKLPGQIITLAVENGKSRPIRQDEQ